MRRGVSATALAASMLCVGCVSQTTRLHFARTVERFHTPSAARASTAAEAHVDATAVQLPPSCDDVKVKAYNHQVCCTGVKDVVAPENLDELVRLIEETRADPARKHLRVVANSHTSNDQICTDGVGISVANFNQIHGFRRHNGVEYVDVDAGVRLSELNRWLYEHNRTIGYTTIGFRGITIGGGIATAVHGSSLVHPSVLSSRLEYIQFVDGTGKRHDVWAPPAPPRPSTAQLQRAVFDPHAPPRPDPHVADRERFRALSANVGMLGVVTRVGLRVEPRFNLDVTVDFSDDGVLWKKGVEALVGRCDWGQLVWLPRSGHVMRVCGMRTTDEAEVGATNVLLQPHLDPGALGAFKELMEDTIANGAYLCDIETERYWQLKSYPPFQHDCCCKKKYTRHAIGPADLMMSSEMSGVESELGEIDYEIAVPLADAADALRRVKDYARANRLCMPLIGAFLRFSPVEDHTLIGHSVTDDGAWKDQKVMFLEFVVYVLHTPESPEEAAQQEHDYYAKYRALALQLVQNDHGRPHWGKNQTPLFVLHKEVDTRYAERLHQFHCWVRKFDPDDRFANDFTRAVGLTPPQASAPATWDDCKRASDEKTE